MKAYIDSSGKSSYKKAKCVTLVAYLGTPAHFDRFEPDWGATLEDHEAPFYESAIGRSRYFHFTEAINLKEGYSEERGWDINKTHSLIDDLLDVFGRSNRTESRLISCTVNLDGYRQARLKKPALPSAEQICADICFTLLFSYADENAQRVSELFVDRGDWFSGRIKSLYGIRKRSRRPWWAKYLASVADADAHLVYPVQAVDLVAGLANRHYSNGQNDQWGSMFALTTLTAPHDHVSYDGPELVDMTDDGGRYIPGVSRIKGSSINFPFLDEQAQ